MSKVKRVLVDMDGVVADFEKRVSDLFTVSIADMINNGSWQEVKEELCNSNFFFELEEMPLVAILKKHIGKFEILTAVGNYNTLGVVELKMLWLDKVFGQDHNIPFHWVNKTHKKAEYAHKNTLLIDDRIKSTNPFENRGGQVILFNNEKEQITEIDNLLSKI